MSRSSLPLHLPQTHPTFRRLSSGIFKGCVLIFSQEFIPFSLCLSQKAFVLKDYCPIVHFKSPMIMCWMEPSYYFLRKWIWYMGISTPLTEYNPGHIYLFRPRLPNHQPLKYKGQEVSICLSALRLIAVPCFISRFLGSAIIPGTADLASLNQTGVPLRCLKLDPMAHLKFPRSFFWFMGLITGIAEIAFFFLR